MQEIRSAMGMGPIRARTMGSNRMSPYDRMERPGAFGRGGRGGKFYSATLIKSYSKFNFYSIVQDLLNFKIFEC